MDRIFVENTNSCSRGLSITLSAMNYLINESNLLTESTLEEGWGKNLAMGLGGLAAAGIGAGLANPEMVGDAAHMVGMSDENAANAQKLFNHGHNRISNMVDGFNGNKEGIVAINSGDVDKDTFAKTHQPQPQTQTQPQTQPQAQTQPQPQGTTPQTMTSEQRLATDQAIKHGENVLGGLGTTNQGVSNGPIPPDVPVETPKSQVPMAVSHKQGEINTSTTTTTPSTSVQNTSTTNNNMINTSQPSKNEFVPTGADGISSLGLSKESTLGTNSGNNIQTAAFSESMGPTGNDDSTARAQRVATFKANQEVTAKQPESFENTPAAKYALQNPNQTAKNLGITNFGGIVGNQAGQYEVQPQEEKSPIKPILKSTPVNASGGITAANDKFGGSQYDRGYGVDANGVKFTYAKTPNRA